MSGRCENYMEINCLAREASERYAMEEWESYSIVQANNFLHATVQTNPRRTLKRA